MSDFNFSVDDLFSDDPKTFDSQIDKFLTHGPQKTSRSAQGGGASAEISTLSTGQIMMGIPLYNDPADAAAKQEYVTSQLLGAAISKEDKEGQGTSLGVFDDYIPLDIKTAADNAAKARAVAETPTDPSATATDPTAGLDSALAATDPAAIAKASADAAALIGNPNCVFRPTGGGRLAKEDMLAGKISPGLIFVLSVLAQKFRIEITCMASDGAGNRNRGHASGSDHYKFTAVDLGAITEVATNQRWDDGASPVVQRAYALLNTITGPRRFKTVIGPMNPGFPNFSYRDDHRDHLHIAMGSW